MVKPLRSAPPGFAVYGIHHSRQEEYMRKLKLRLDDLRVDTFDTSAVRREKGTVFGEQCTCYTQCTCPGCPTCAGYATCDGTCNGTCGASCNGTCDFTCDASCNGTCGDTCNYTCESCQFSYCDYTCYNGVLGMFC